jgi:hypothetical protein
MNIANYRAVVFGTKKLGRINQSINPSIHQSTHLSIYPSINPSINQAPDLENAPLVNIVVSGTLYRRSCSSAAL